MVNKKGWLRIFEASIAVIIIIAVLFSIGKNSNYNYSSDNYVESVIDEIVKSDELRQKILNEDNVENEIEAIISGRVGIEGINYRVRICNINEICSLDREIEESKEIHSFERIISAYYNNEIFSPKKAKVYIWKS